MEVNSKVLSTEDVEKLEKEITKILPTTLEDKLKEVLNSTDDEDLKKKIEDRLNKMQNEAKIKLILPERYHTSDGKPFPDELDYIEYLIMIVKNLDQFVKMLIDINNGGNGDTSNVSSQDVKDALGDEQSAMDNLDNLMKRAGMSEGDTDSSADSDSDGEGGDGESSSNDSSNSGGFKGTSDKIKAREGTRADKFSELEEGSHKDHGTNSRDLADRKREKGEIRAGGGTGCSSNGGSNGTREVTKTDEVDEAIDLVLRNYKSKVVKRDIKRDMMWNYNKGINRNIIAPAILPRVTIKEDPKIVYLIDISGSMDTGLVDRILNTIAKKMKTIGRGLNYDIISWNTNLGEHLRDINPRKGVPRISYGGGTCMAKGIKYFRDNYDESAVLVIISDFEDYLEEWKDVEKDMNRYALYGFNYGARNPDITFKNITVRNFNVNYNRRW